MRLSLKKAPLKLLNPATLDPLFIAALPLMFGKPGGIFEVQSPPFMKGGDRTSVIQAGLPNITGTFVTEDTFLSGAFYTKGALLEGNAADGRDFPIYFDASRCSNVYGRNSTVQPPAIQILQQIKY